MKDRILQKALLASILSFALPTVNADEYGLTSITDFSGWSEPVTNSQVTLQGSGEDNYVGVNTDSIADALFATVQVTSANCPSDCQIQLRRKLGVHNGDNISAVIRVEYWEGKTIVTYRIHRYKRTTNDYVSNLAAGGIGSSDGAWNLNGQVDIAVGIKDREVIFYSSNEDTLTKIELWGEYIPSNPPIPYRFQVYTDTNKDSITATIFNFHEVAITK